MATFEVQFTVDAWLVGGRWQHHRLRDHFGSESDLNVALEGPLGHWMQGTPIHYVLEDLWNRTQALESAAHMLGTFKVDAVIGMYFTASALIHGSVSGSFLARAWMAGGGRFTCNAVIRGGARVTADAVIV